MLDLSKYKLILFDFDGVIVDTEWLHFLAFNKVLNNFGIKITKSEYLNKYLAYDDKGCFFRVFQEKLNKQLTNKEIKKLVLEKTKILMSLLKRNFNYYKDAVEFIKHVRKNFKNIKLCIVSGALRKEINYVLKKLNIKKVFSVVISAEDVKNGKPSPEPYLTAKHAAEKKFNNKFKNDEILVVEDSINGIIAAKNAGFKVIAVAHTYKLNKLKRTKPFLLVKTLSELIKKENSIYKGYNFCSLSI